MEIDKAILNTIAIDSEEALLPEPDPPNQVRAFVDCIQSMLAFAEEQEDYLLAARLEDVRLTFMDRHLPAES